MAHRKKKVRNSEMPFKNSPDQSLLLLWRKNKNVTLEVLLSRERNFKNGEEAFPPTRLLIRCGKLGLMKKEVWNTMGT